MTGHVFNHLFLLKK